MNSQINTLRYMVCPVGCRCCTRLVMPTALKRVMLNVPEALAVELEKLAKAERRPMANLCLVLVEEALEARKKSKK